MAEIVTLLQNVAQKIRRCPEPTLVHAYREAARQFCVESRWLRRTVLLGVAEADESVDITLASADADLTVVGVRAIRAYSPASPQSDWAVPPSDPTVWRLNQPAARPTCYAYEPEAIINLPAPSDAAYTFRVIAQCQPSDTTESLPDDLLAKWVRQIDRGALAYLYDIPGQQWSNPQLAALESRRFQAAINNAKADEQRNNNTGTVMARIPRRF